MGVRGPTPPVRGRCREATEGVGWRSYGHEVPVGRRRRNYPAYYEPDLKPAPSSAPVCALGHLPPRGKALVGNRPLTRPFGPPSPQGEGFGGESPPHPALRATFPPGGRLWWGIVSLIRPFGPPSPEREGLQAAKGRPYKSPRRRDTPKTKIRPSPQTGTTYWRR